MRVTEREMMLDWKRENWGAFAEVAPTMILTLTILLTPTSCFARAFSWMPVETSAFITRAVTFAATGIAMDFPFDVDFCSTREQLNAMLEFQIAAAKLEAATDSKIPDPRIPGFDFLRGRVCKIVDAKYMSFLTYVTGEAWIKHTTRLPVNCHQINGMLEDMTKNYGTLSSVHHNLRLSTGATSWLRTQATKQVDGSYRGITLTDDLREHYHLWSRVTHYQASCGKGLLDGLNYVVLRLTLSKK